MKEAQLDKQIKELKKQKALLRGRRIWKCSHCNKGTVIKKLHLIVIQYYVRPYSCTGGDYWTTGKEPEYNIVCPKCGTRIREYPCSIRPNSESRWKFVHDHRNSFRSEEYEYRDD